jgi:hypothetical protein
LSDYAPLLEVIDCEDDFGPGTKVLGCLDHLPPRACLIIADDDMHYKPYFLEVLYQAQIADLRSSFSFWTYRCGPLMVGQGADGFSFYSDNLWGIQAFATQVLAHHQLRIHDDLWISAYLRKKGIAVRSLKHLIPRGETVYVATHSMNQLHQLEGNMDREAVATAGMQFLLESGLMGEPARVVALTKRTLRNLRNLLARR